jgi:CHAD domain-containing protein
VNRLKGEMKKFEKAYPKISGQIISQIDSAGQLNQRIDAPQAFQIRLEKRIQKQLDSEKPDLHLIRRIIKQKVYVFDTFQESELLSFYQEFRAEWKILESSMGKWHDQLVFQFWLNKGLKWKRLKDEEYKTMLKLIAWLKSSTDRMEEQLINSIPRVNI